MKSLERVIKTTIRLIDVNKPESYDCGELLFQHHSGEKNIYFVKDLNNKNIIELMKEITPLIYWLISKCRKENEEEGLLKKIFISLELPPNKKILKCF